MRSPFLPRGLGDVAHAVARPVAVVIDAATKAIGKPTNLKECGGCKKRKEDLNAKFPFEQH